MAAPAWSDVVQSQSASLVTPIVVTMPTNLATGDRVVIFITMGRNRTQGLNWNTGTTGFVSALGGTTFNTAGNDHEHDFGYADIPGTPPATISITPSQTKAFIAWAGRIPAGTFDPATAPEFTTTPNSADPANLDPSWTEDTLFIAGISADELTFITFPLPDDQDSDEISNVSGAVCSIGQTGGGARNVAAWATTEANLKGVATVCLRASAAGTPATVTPAAIACTASLPTSSRNIAAGPAATAITVSLPASSRIVAAGPVVVAVAVSFPQASAGQSISVQPAAVATSAALPAVGASVSASPAVTATVVSLPAAATSTDAAVQPAAVAVGVSTPQVAASVTAGPAVTAVVVSLPQAAAGAATVVTPAPVAATVALPAGSVALTATATPTAISCPVALPQAAPVIEGGAVVAPAAIACTVSAPLALSAAQTVVSPAVAAVLAALPTLAVLAAATAIPGVVAALASVPQATASGGGQPSGPVAASFTESFGATYRESPPREFRESA